LDETFLGRHVPYNITAIIYYNGRRHFAEQKMKKYDLFLFDADGTLFDYDMAEANALKITFDYCGFYYSESIHSKYREINSQVWKSYEKAEITKTELQTQRFTRLFNRD
jgi:FMN phosphatase YigB (HAD superfamily)